MTPTRIAFVTRNVIVNELGGSTTAAINLFKLLAPSAHLTVCTTAAYCRSPRLFFKRRVPLPAGVTLSTPGYLCVGPWCVAPFNLRAWARIAVRLALRVNYPTLARTIIKAFRGAVVDFAWDLTPITAAETAAALHHIARTQPTVVIVNYAYLAPLFHRAELAGKKSVILMHDLLSARIAEFRRNNIPLDCPIVSQATELDWLNSANFVLAIQKAEAAKVQALLTTSPSSTPHAEILVQPITLPIHTPSLPIAENRCLFVGTSIQPNTTGILWFLAEVWPHVRAASPTATLHIAGSVCEDVPSPPAGVTLCGILPSLDPEVEAATVCLVPLLIGSGIKIKLLEALAFGKACVSTSIGVQGLEDWTADAISVADSPRAFATAILELFADPALRQQREQAAHTLIRNHFSSASAPAQRLAETILS